MTDDTQETFISHLVELRDRLIRSIVAVIVCFLALVNWAREIYSLLAAPMLAALPRGGHMIATDVAGAFFVPMKVTLMVGFLLALPYVLYQAWAFIAPGLYSHEKKLVLPLVVSSVLLFFLGMCFAYFVVFPIVFAFVNRFAPEGVAVMTDIDKYLSFVLSTFMAFGITFEVPVIVVVLVRTGLVSIEKLRDIRPYVIVGAFVVGAIFTPPDMVSQFLMAMPLWLLYELGVLVAGIITRRADAAAATALTTSEMDRELDRAEAESRKLRGE